MTPLSRWAFPVLAFLLCGAAGWGVAGLGEQPSAALQPETAVAGPGKSSDRSKALPSRKGVPEEVGSLLIRVHSAKTPTERARAAAELAIELPVDEMGRWYAAGWIGAENSPEAMVFHRITRNRWLRKDADGMMNFLIKHEHEELNNAAKTWAALDPKAALEFFFAQEKDSHARRRMDSAIVMGLKDDADPGLLFSALGKVEGTGPSFPRFFAGKLVELCATSAPERLAVESANWPDDLKMLAKVELSRRDLEKDPAGTLARLGSDPEGRQIFAKALQKGGDLLPRMLERIDEWPEGALAEIAENFPNYLVSSHPDRWLGSKPPADGLSDSQWEKVRESAIRQMIYKDPRRGLESLLGIDLSQEERQMAITQAFQKAALDDGPLPHEMLALLSDEDEIAAAKAAIESNRKPRDRTEDKPPSTIEWIGKMIGQGGQKADSFSSTPMNWSRSDEAAARQYFQTLPAEEKLKAARGIIQSSLPFQEHLTADAIAYLAEPKAEGKSGERATLMTLVFMSRWGDRDPGEASRWAQSLPQGELRTDAINSLAGKWSEYDPAEARRWIATLPEKEQALVKEHVERQMKKHP